MHGCFVLVGEYVIVISKQPLKIIVLETSFFRHQRYRTLVVLVMISSWLFMLVSATCAMPKPIQAEHSVAVSADDCDQSGDHAGHGTQPSSQADCSFKPCPNGTSPAFNFKLDKPEIPLALLCLTWLCGWIFHYRPVQTRLKRFDIPVGKPVPLIYRFCILLN